MCIRQHYPCFSAALVTITLARPMPSTSSRRHVKKHAPQYEAVPSRSELPLSDNSDPTPCAWTGQIPQPTPLLLNASNKTPFRTFRVSNRSSTEASANSGQNSKRCERQANT
ncbi:hypothetical protein BDY17DRAFT_304954 [Neohortaea acidophila]|uniref:Uncharacterized protein n=1 Tax=Neohortaea acidophila TaxID=245834 RepID=A0A6A6PHL2_9PEZI|nr:uncharacterized protein BDY17DRAFT_304954 [Neohortaea acidophila]KAF2479083.1 hypothetical protein BDY17DRAFT_304954 [Neohortaea acidophila]